jgi:Cu-Zn family superoxide dismutase
MKLSRGLGKRSGILLVFVAVLLVLLVTSAAWAHPHGMSFALARIVDAEGDTVGAAALTQHEDEGVRIFVWAKDLAPGKHGIHIHSVGNCDPAGGFVAAGSHFNPEAKLHGLSNPAGPHAGDSPNLRVRPVGLGILRATNERVSLGEGPTSLFDADGSAMVIHAGEDDQTTDPTGNSGPRIGCGVIRPSS